MILGKSVTPCEGEVSIKSYQCTEFDSRLFGINAKGFLEVTNKRLLFQALGKGMNDRSVIHSEVSITDVSEIKIYKGSSFKLIQFILGILLSIMIGVAFKSAIRNDTVGILMLLGIIAGAIYWLLKVCRKQAFSLIINTKGGSGKVVSIAGLSPFGEGSSIASKALEAKPSKDSELLFMEIGAVVLDIQNMGENAIEKWKK